MQKMLTVLKRVLHLHVVYSLANVALLVNFCAYMDSKLQNKHEEKLYTEQEEEEEEKLYAFDYQKNI